MNGEIQKLRELGYTTITEDFYSKIKEWDEWYKGNVERFHSYRAFNGQRYVKCSRYTLGMAKKVCEDWASLLLNEKVKITLEGDKEQEFLDAVLQRNAFSVRGNEAQEMAFALGTIAFIPRVVGFDGDAASGIAIDTVRAENIFPISWATGKISECAFSNLVFRGDRAYLYLQIHVLDDRGQYVIENHMYAYANGQAGNEVQLTEVKGYESVPAVVNTRSTERQFAIDRPNISNNYNYDVPLGLSVYANAIDSLKSVDIAFDAYVNEFVLGKKRVMVSNTALKNLDTDELAFDPSDLAYYVLPEGAAMDAPAIKEIDMSLRTAEFSTGIQDALNQLASKCGFGEKFYSFSQGSVATATQVVAENSTLFRRIKKHEIILKDVLTELVHIILRLGNTAMNAGLDENVEMSIDFDDSIIEDKASEFARDMQLLAAGVLNAYEIRMKYMNEDEKTAKAALPGMEDMTTEEEDETE